MKKIYKSVFLTTIMLFVSLMSFAQNSLYIEPFSIAPGEQKQIEVLLDNPGEKFSQLQFDIALPDGVEIVFDEDNFCYIIDRGSRLASVYNIDAQDVSGGVKVLALTTNPKAYIKEESGDVLLITVQAAEDIADGVYDLSINNVVLSHQDGSTVKAASTTAAITVSSATEKEYPFTLTKEGEEPVLYIIYSGRDGSGDKGSYAFTNITPWGGSRQELCLNNQDPRYPLSQIWYFMEAEDGNIKIISAEDNKLITVANTNDAAKCTTMLSENEITTQYYTWILDETNGCYAFKTSDGKTYLSHNGNWTTGGQQMGLYNANGNQDEGSRVFFELAPAGIETGVIDIEAENALPVIYSIIGQRIDKITTAGIYIVNGKKVIVK